MKSKTIKELALIAKKRQKIDDPSHDFEHVKRVLNMAIKIGKAVDADLDVIIPAALFHDTVVYRKDSKQSLNEANESAEVAARILGKINNYPETKIADVKTCIQQCSFTKGIVPDLLESKVLQDADLLESTGAISIIRTFSSCGHMNRPFYNERKPFYEKNEKDFPSGVGLFYRRLLVVEKRLHSSMAKNIAKRRSAFLKKFLNELEIELQEAKIIK